jgi:hypothetical protein
MNQQLVRTNAILPFAAVGNADLTGKEGYWVKADAATGRVALLTSGSDMPFGVIVRGAAAPEKNSIALGFGGLAGTVRVKIAADIAFVAALKTRADAACDLFTGSPGEVMVGMALESGLSGELIEVALCTPVGS